MNDSVEVERLDIKITADIGNAKRNLDAFNSSFKDFKAQLDKAINPDTFAQFRKLSESLSNLAQIKVPNSLGKAADELSKATGQIKGADVAKTKEEYEEATEGTSQLSQEIDRLGARVQNTTSRFNKFFSSIKRIAMYRAIRAVLQSIAQGFHEGMQACYQYSKTIDGTFAKSLDSIATSTTYLKNSLGAMVAPIVNIVAPAIDWLVDKFVGLLNVVNEVIARISGASTWTKALKIPVEYAEAVENATKANEKFKASIMSFDELHVLNDNSNNGAGKSGADDSGNFKFVEMPVAQEADGIFKAINNVTTAFERLWNSQGFQNIRAGIGKFISGASTDVIAGIGDITNAVSDLINLDWGGLSTDVGRLGGRLFALSGDGAVAISTMIFGEDSDITQSIQTKLDNWRNALDEYGLSGAMASWMKDTAIELLNDSALSDSEKLVGTTWYNNIYNGFVEELQTNGLGAALENYGIPYLKLSWNGFLIWLKQHSIVGTIDDELSKIKEKIKPITDWFEANVKKPLTDKFANLKNSILGDINRVKSWFTKSFLQVSQTGSDISHNFKVISSGLNKTFTNLWGGFKEKAGDAWEVVKSKFSKVGSFFKNTFSKAWNGIKDVFGKSDVLVSIKDSVSGAFSKMLNGLIDGFNKVITVPFNRINDGLKALKNFSIFGNKPFEGLKEISIPQIPHLSSGGVLEKGQIGFLEGNGAEAVIPLENNKKWISRVAAEMNSQIAGVGMANANNAQMADMIARGVTDGVRTATAQQSNLLRSILTILGEIERGGQTITISTNDIISALDRNNRRRGTVVVPVGT